MDTGGRTCRQGRALVVLSLPQAGEGRRVTRRIGAVRCLDRYSTYLERSVSFAMPESCLLT